MYNIDINFLKDRKLDALAGTTTYKKKSATSAEDKLPLLMGTGVAVALVAIAGGALFFLNNQKTSQTEAIAQLETEIQRLQGKNQEISQIQSEIDGITREIAILVSVFDQIKPWSAMLGEIASVTPNNIQIRSLNQSEDGSLIINGYADSYDQVNDLFLTLKNSPLLNSEATKLTTTSLVDNPSSVIFDRAQLYDSDIENPDTGVTVELPKVVLYTITTAITDESSQKYLNQLNRQGAIGLVSRLTTLQRKGVLNIELPKAGQTSAGGETQP